MLYRPKCMGRWLIRAGLGGLVAMTLAACSSTTTGTVVGTFADLHGPYATGTLAFSGIVKFASTSRTYTIHVGPSGRFSLRVIPGYYRVTGTSPSYHGPTCTGGTIHVIAGQVASVDVNCLVS